MAAPYAPRLQGHQALGALQTSLASARPVGCHCPCALQARGGGFTLSAAHYASSLETGVGVHAPASSGPSLCIPASCLIRGPSLASRMTRVPSLCLLVSADAGPSGRTCEMESKTRVSQGSQSETRGSNQGKQDDAQHSTQGAERDIGHFLHTQKGTSRH